MSQIEERFKFSCRLYIIIKTIYIWCKKRMFFDNFPHFLITFLAALPPCRHCFHRIARFNTITQAYNTTRDRHYGAVGRTTYSRSWLFYGL